MRRLLLLQPLRVFKRWPMPDDFTGLVLGSPTLAFGMLAGSLKGRYEFEYMDGIVREWRLDELSAAVHRCDAVLINAHSSIGSLNVEQNVRHILETAPNKPIILGGHHATVYDFEWLGRGAHYVVRNEGERTIVALMDAIERGAPVDGIAGLSWRGPDSTFHRNPDRALENDLDSLPMPDWSIYDPKDYQLPLEIPGYATTAETSRGCNHKCHFCAASKMWFHAQRYKSPERVLEELRILQRMGYTKIWFADDNFGADPERYQQIYEGMLREEMKFNFMVFIRPDTITKSPETIALARRAGLRAVLVGFETPNDRLLKDIRKASAYSIIQQSYEILRQNQIFIGAFFMVGYLGETQEETDATFRAAAEMSDYPIISIFEPRKGTVDYDRSAEENELSGGDMFYHNTVRFITSKTHILKQYRKFYARYLVAPRQIQKLLAGTPTERRWFRNLYGNMARSYLDVSPQKVAHPWQMVRDVWE